MRKNDRHTGLEDIDRASHNLLVYLQPVKAIVTSGSYEAHA